MGFFSYLTADTRESISNTYSSRGALPVKMLLPDGRVFEERDYKGYGHFGGYDIHLAIADLNGVDSQMLSSHRRMIGIDLESKAGTIRPRIVTIDCPLPYDDLPDNDNDPAQGYFY